MDSVDSHHVKPVRPVAYLRTHGGLSGRRVSNSSPPSGVAAGDVILGVIRGDVFPPGTAVPEWPPMRSRFWVQWARGDRDHRTLVEVLNRGGSSGRPEGSFDESRWSTWNVRPQLWPLIDDQFSSIESAPRLYQNRPWAEALIAGVSLHEPEADDRCDVVVRLGGSVDLDRLIRLARAIDPNRLSTFDAYLRALWARESRLLEDGSRRWLVETNLRPGSLDPVGATLAWKLSRGLWHDKTNLVTDAAHWRERMGAA